MSSAHRDMRRILRAEKIRTGRVARNPWDALLVLRTGRNDAMVAMLRDTLAAMRAHHGHGPETMAALRALRAKA